MNPAYKWFKTSGIISPEKWGNLPGGECFTSPGEVNGIFVVDGVVGDWLCARYGLLARVAPHHRDRKRTASSRAAAITSNSKQDFWAYTHTDENSDRVGEFAIGTNIGSLPRNRQHPAGRKISRHPHCLRQSLRGTHRRTVAFGTHIDVVGLGFNIWLESETDEEQIMQDGRFLIST